MSGGGDDNTFELAKHIFSKPPSSPFSHQFFFDEETCDIAKKNDTDAFINEVLFVITWHGVELLFGHRDLTKLSENNIELIRRYTRSYGYDIHLQDTIKFVPLRP